MPRDTPYSGVAAIFRSCLERGEAPRVFEDGGQRRDFVHVRDVARANLLALHAGVPGAFNVASGTPRSVGEMARTLAHGEIEVTGEWRAGDVRLSFHPDQFVVLPNNTIEIKAGWRVLNPGELTGGRFHTQTVRYYEKNSSGGTCPQPPPVR